MNFVTPPNEKIIIIFKRKKNFPTNLKSFFYSLFPIKNQERSRFSNSSKESGGNLLYWNNSLTQRTLKIFPSGSNKNSLRARSLLSSVGQVFIYSLQYGDIQCGMRQKDGWRIFIESVKLFLPPLPGGQKMWNVNRVAVSFISFLRRLRNSRENRKKSSIGDSL